MCFNTSTGLYSCQLDEKWFNIHKDLLRDALDITPTNDNNPFVAPPSSDTIIKYVNTLGYPSTLRNVSAVSGQDIMCFRSFRVSFIALTLTMRKGSGKSLFVGKDGREIFSMPIPDVLLTDEIKGAPYYGDYQEHVAKYQQFLDLRKEKQ
ncbi:hypothetical protein Tco_0113283 [Tanacetum coccineum]